MPRKTNWAALLLAAPLFAYILYPLGAMLSESLTLPVEAFRANQMGWNPGAQPFAAPLRSVFNESNMLAAVWGTLKISVWTVVTGALLGTGLALLWSRREFPGRRLFAALGYAPMLLPPLVGTLALFSLIGEAGAVWRVIPGGRAWVSPFGQVLAVHTYSFGVYSYAFVAAALSGADFSHEDAARNLGAGWLNTLWTAVWPVMRPSLLAAALLTFMASAASFSAPNLLDNSSRYLTVEIFSNSGDPGMQRALSTVLAGISLAVLPAFLYFSGRAKGLGDLGAGTKSSAGRCLPPASKAGATWRVLLSLAVCALLLAPLLTLAATVVLPRSSGGAAQGWLDAFLGLRDDDWHALGRSAVYGCASALIDVGIASLAALALRRASFAASLPVEFAVMLALALPGSTVAVALLSAFNAPSPLFAGTALGHTAAILILAYVIRNLALAVRPARAALQAIGGDIEDAAAGLGARRRTVIWRVILPLMLPSLLAAGLFCFINAAGEYVASMLLFDVSTRPVSVRIGEHFRTNIAGAYALALCLMGLCAGVVVLGRWAAERRRIN